MIRKVTMWQARCNGCGKVLGYDEIVAWDSRESLLCIMADSGWLELGKGQHYCPDCYEVDDNDNYVPVKRENNNP